MSHIGRSAPFVQHLFRVYYVARQLLPSLFGFFIFFFFYFLYILYYNFFKKSKNNTYFRKEVATGEGLEPPTVLPATVFKTAPSSSRIPAKCVSTKNNETFLWWGTWDLNPHVLRRQSLNLVRLPFRQSPMVNELRYCSSIFILPTKKTLGAYFPFRKN